MSQVITDPEKIDWFLNHAVENVYPSKEKLQQQLLSGVRLSMYWGIDPTGPTLHLGHTVPLGKLAELQALGHKIILLIGDFTAMIGDPTDKMATRKVLTRDEVLKNCKLYQEQASHFLKFDGDNPAELRFNSEWLSKMSFGDVVELAAHFTVQQMLERDMFEKRIAEGKPVHLHEFLYPLMQGYDSVAMDVDMEVCGNDQTFNALAGRTLMREVKQKEKFVVTMRLLTDPTGKKMGKSEGNMVSFTDTPEDMFGKIMSWSDEMIIPSFEICTQTSKQEIAEMKEQMQAGENPMRFKRMLAERIVERLCGSAAAKFANDAFTKVHQEGEQPEQMEEIAVGQGKMTLVDALTHSGLVDSKSEARRQIEQGGIKMDGQVVTDVKTVLEITRTGLVLQKGKRHFAKLVLA